MDRRTAALSLRVAQRAARVAGAIQEKAYGHTHQIRNKAPFDLVTEIDVRSQKAILKEIRKVFPTHDILAEEKGAPRSESPYRWVIDPLDGTTNYAHDYPMFAVSIGLEHEGKMVLGVIYHSRLREMFWAVRGKGAYLNGKRLRCSQISKLTDGVFATGFPHQLSLKKKSLKYFTRLLTRTQAIRRSGSAALDLAHVACGRLEGYWDLSLNAWDLAAGTLLVTEAGGIVSSLTQNQDFSIYRHSVLASNKRVYKTLLKELRSVKD